MDIVNIKNVIEKHPVLHVGIFIYILMGMMFFGMMGNGIFSAFGAIIVGYIGAVIGNAFRLYSMPDAYFTDGTLWGSFKAKFYWRHGPQIIGFFSIWIVIFQLLILG